MADKASIAIRKHNAVERIQHALNRLLEDYGKDPVDIARTHRYPDALYNHQLETVAAALEQLSPAPEVVSDVMDSDEPFGEPDAERITEFDVTAEGVIVATDDDGEPVVSDGQDEPEEPPVKGKGRK